MVSTLYVIALLLTLPFYLTYYILVSFIFPLFLYAFEAIARTPCISSTVHNEVKPGDGCAFVTGADSGIGKEIALNLAGRGFDLVLTGHHGDTGGALEKEMKAKNPAIRVVYFAVRSRNRNPRVHITHTSPSLSQADLSEPDAATLVYETLFPQLPSWCQDVSILVNDAGVGYYGAFVNVPTEKLQKMVQLNNNTPVSPTSPPLSPLECAPCRVAIGWAHELLPQAHAGAQARLGHEPRSASRPTAQQNWSHPSPQREYPPRPHPPIGSIQSFDPGPSEATYGATKAFLLSISRAMHYELRSTGVSVTAACPGFTQTHFWKPGEEPLGAKVPCLLQQVSACAAQCVDGMFARKPCASPFLFPRAHHLLPSST